MKQDDLVIRGDTACSPANTLQQRYRFIRQEIERLRGELRDIKRQLTVGACEECGRAFSRQRPTKRFCSQSCLMAAYHARTHDGEARIALIREMWTVIVASGQLTPRAIAVLERVVIGRKSLAETGEAEHVSRQRVEQLLGRAAKLAKFCKVIQQASTAAQKAVS